MTTDRRSLFPGILLIGLGLILLLPNITDLRIRDIWALIVLLTGIAFFAAFLADRSRTGFLIPAGVLTTIGGLFLYCSLEGWWHMRSLWPVFIAAPGVGFLLQYLFGKHDQAVLHTAMILLGIAVVFLAFLSEGGLILPLLLIVLGAFFLFFRH
jgi:hypothetical protein